MGGENMSEGELVEVGIIGAHRRIQAGGSGLWGGGQGGKVRLERGVSCPGTMLQVASLLSPPPFSMIPNAHGGSICFRTCVTNHPVHTFEDWMSISNPAAAAALTTGSNRLGSGVGWRRSSEHDGKCATIFSATEMLARSIISSTIWLASRT